MAQRKIVITELGEEMQCSRCSEYWPADEEFWYREGARGFHAWCKACYREWRRANDKKKAAKAAEVRAAA